MAWRASEWAVNAYRNDDGWNVNRNSVDNPNPWNAGNVLISRNSSLSPALSCGSFRFQPLLPSADHPTERINFFGEKRVFFVVQSLQFPCDTQEKFQSVSFSNRSRNRGKFLVSRLVARSVQKFQNLNKIYVYSVPERIACAFGKVIPIPVPQLVYCYRMLDDRQNPLGGGHSRRIQFTHSYEDIISVGNLLAAWREFVRGKRKKDDVQEFQYKLMDNILALHRDLKEGTYKHGGYQHFRISDPKPRDIHKATVRDRLLHHALYRKLYPFFDRTFIADSYSCRRGKGTHKAMNRFRQFAYKVSRNHTSTCWVLKCDIRKFFASIDQEIINDIVSRYIPNRRIVGLIAEVVGSFRTHKSDLWVYRGLPLGNLTSQLLVNVYMNEFDHYVKHRLSAGGGSSFGGKAKYYIRYADDFVILSISRPGLDGLLASIKDFLRLRLNLNLHPDKVSIINSAAGESHV